MTQLTQFPRYSQKENWATNHTLLLMRRLYEFNLSKFRRFLKELLKELDDESADIASHLGVVFEQQIRGKRSIPDGVFMQESVKVIVETKIGTSFDRKQIRHHLNGLKEEKHGLLILLSPIVEQIPNDVELKPDDKPLLSTTFANVIKCAQDCLAPHDEEMKSVVDDFEAFCSEEGLLPMDNFRLMVVPCSINFPELMKYGLYYCPTYYKHRQNSRYLGLYADKSIQGIGEIEKRVECTVDMEAGEVIADGLEEYEKSRILAAAQAAKNNRGCDISHDHRFYICDKIVRTDFKKTSAYGIQGHRYLDLRTYLGDGVLPEVKDRADLEDIANRLRNTSWGSPTDKALPCRTPFERSEG